MHKFFRSSLWIPLIAFVVVAPSNSQGEQNSSVPLLRLVGADGGERSVTQEDWAKLPRAVVKAVDHGGATATFEGVPARELLNLVSVPFGPDLRGQQLALYVVAEAADGYKVVYALPEFDPGFTDGVILIADRKDGEALPPKEGPVRVVVPWEKRQARWVRQLTGLRVGRAQ